MTAVVVMTLLKEGVVCGLIRGMGLPQAFEHEETVHPSRMINKYLWNGGTTALRLAPY